MARCAEVFRFLFFRFSFFIFFEKVRVRETSSTTFPSSSDFPNLPLPLSPCPATPSDTITWPVAGLVAERPHDYRRRIFVSLNHPRAALDDGVEPDRLYRL